jgi:Protein of unknown function (DUF1302)
MNQETRLNTRPASPHVPFRICAPILTATAAAALLSCSLGAAALEVKTGVDGLALSWDTSLKYSNAFRLKERNPVLIADPNSDDGDRNFSRGLISNRVDLLSELTGKYHAFGLRLSGAGWYDTVYNRSGHDASPSQNTLPAHMGDGGFANATRKLHGRKAEILDAFVSMDFDVGGRTGVVRLGQHAQVWGESLFYGTNAVSGAMTPVDAIKLASVPGTQFKEALLPVPQVSAQWQLNTFMSVAAYYQMRWRKSRLPAAGSYFSSGDAWFDGSDQLISTIPGDTTYSVAGPAVPRGPDINAKDSGQGGLAFKLRAMDTDFGLYWVRFHDKTPSPVIAMAMVTTPGGVQPVPVGYNITYHEGTNVFGASASHTVDAWNFAIEASVRNNQSLGASKAASFVPFDNAGNAANAVGKTAHLNLNVLGSLGPSALWNDASLLAEVAWNRVLSVSRNAATLNSAHRDGLAATVAFTPTYYQIVSGVDLDVPLVVSFAPKYARSAFIGPSQTTKGGSISLGLAAKYIDTWRFSANYTHYYGAAQPGADVFGNFTYGQYLADRDFLSFSLSRNF